MVSVVGERSTEEVSQQRQSRQLRGSSLLLLGRCLSLGTNFLTQVVIVRSLTTGDYGAFAAAADWRITRTAVPPAGSRPSRAGAAAIAFRYWPA